MAFTLANWANASASLNQGQETVVPYGGSSTVLNAPNLFCYLSPNDTVATIEASNYFLSMYPFLSVGDMILGGGTDTSMALVVTAVSSTSVTTASMGLTSSIGTANIQANAVTYAKIQQTSAGSVLIGNPTGSAANVEEITLGNGLAFSGTSLLLNTTYLNVVEVSLTATQFNGMYATPVQVIAAPGANKVIVVGDVILNMTFGTTQFTAGGAVGLQYGSSAHLAGAAASATEAASDYTGAAASTLFRIGGGLSTGAAISSAANAAVYISNATQAFASGDSTFKVWISYRILPTNS